MGLSSNITSYPSLTICPGALHGTVDAIPSKSVAHRALICSALAQTPTTLLGRLDGDDVQATRRCLEAIRLPLPLLDCGESGTTLRFLLPIVAALGCGACFTGRGRLGERPLTGLLQTLTSHGITCHTPEQGGFPLEIRGRLTGDRFSIDAGTSSQYVSGLLLALPLLGHTAALVLEGNPASKPYIDLTVAVMETFGVHVQTTATGYRLEGPQTYQGPQTLSLEGDWSNAAPWLVGAALSGSVSVRGLQPKSAQGDRILFQLLHQMGAATTYQNGMHTVQQRPLRALDYDATHTPDIVPLLALACASAQGVSHLSGVSRLRAKESDRLAAVVEVLSCQGIRCTASDEILEIEGGTLQGGPLPVYNDHRMVMMEVISGLVATRPVTVQTQSITKSYPQFVLDFQSIGGNIYGI